MENVSLSDFLGRHWLAVILTAIVSISIPIIYGLGNLTILLGLFTFLIFLFAILDFRFSLYLLIITMFLGGYLVYKGHISVPFLAMCTVFLSYLVKGIILGKLPILRTPLDKAILIFMLVIALSFANVRYTYLAIWTYLWHVSIFILFYIIASSIESSSLRKFILFLIFLAVLHSVHSLTLSISSSGAGRVFGIGGTYAAGLTEIAFLFSLSFFLFEERVKHKILWGLVLLVLLAASLAHKTRGTVIALVVGYIFTNVIVLSKSVKLGLKFARRNILMLATLMTSTVILLFYKSSAFLEGFGRHSYYTIIPIDTTQIRFFLWKLALEFFFQNPILGIGLGQFSKLSTLSLEPKYQLFYLAIVNLGTHNLLLSYLCETGVIGALCFLYLLYCSLKLAWSKYGRSIAIADLKLSGALLGVIFHITTNSFYSGAWFSGANGMIFAYILAWIVIFKPGSST